MVALLVAVVGTYLLVAASVAVVVALLVALLVAASVAVETVAVQPQCMVLEKDCLIPLYHQRVVELLVVVVSVVGA